MHKHLKTAQKHAPQHEFDQYLEYKLCAVIVKAGTPISTGFNNKKTNGFVEHYATKVRGVRDYCVSTHAEMDAVLKVRKNTDLSGCKIYVARILASDDLALARPCDICQDVLFSYGIKKAYYTISNDEYGVMTLNHDADGTFTTRSRRV